MVPCDTRRMHPRRKGPAFYVLVLLFLSSTTLFIFTYRYFSSPSLTSSFEVPYEDTRPTRGFSIELHPKDYIRRLPTSLTHHWNITKGLRAPDGVNKTVYLINGGQPRARNILPRDLADYLLQANFLALPSKHEQEINSSLPSQIN